jgi:hypothetical protein
MFRLMTRIVTKDGAIIREEAAPPEEQRAYQEEMLRLPAEPHAEIDGRVVGREALLTGLKGASEMNGWVVELVSWDAGAQRFTANVQEQPRAPILVRPRNLAVVPRGGDLVYVKSLKRAGLVGSITFRDGVVPPPSLGARERAARAVEIIIFGVEQHVYVPLTDCEVRSPQRLPALAGNRTEANELSGEQSLERMFPPGADDVVLLGDCELQLSAHDTSTGCDNAICLVLHDPRSHAMPADLSMLVSPPPSLPSTSTPWDAPPMLPHANFLAMYSGSDSIDLRPRSWRMVRGLEWPRPPPSAA